MKRMIKVAVLLVFLLLIGTLLVSAQTATSTPITNTTTTNAQQATWVAVFYDTTTPGTGSSQQTSFTGLNRNFAGSPIDGIPADGWSARFTTTATFATGFWNFTAFANDGVRVLVNGSVVIDALANVGTTSRSNTVNLTGGTYNVVVELIDQTDEALIQVNWASTTDPGTGGGTGGLATTAPVTTTSVTGVLGLAVRSGPFLGASMVGVARPGTSYPVLARNTQEGLFTWYLIRYDEDTIGWSSGRYLSFPEGTSVAAPLDNDTQFDDADDPAGTVIGVTRSVMNFRRYPSERVGRVAGQPQLVWGAEVQIIARTIQGGKDFWYQVRYSPEDSDTVYTGWIFAPYVGIAAGSDPIDSVPIK